MKYFFRGGARATVGQLRVMVSIFDLPGRTVSLQRPTARTLSFIPADSNSNRSK